VSHFSSLLYSVIIPSAVSDYSSLHPNNKFRVAAPDPPVLLAFSDVCLIVIIVLICLYECW